MTQPVRLDCGDTLTKGEGAANPVVRGPRTKALPAHCTRRALPLVFPPSGLSKGEAMASIPVEHWKIEKTVARAAGGVVAAQSAPAAAVGAEVLADGGNAVDAAVATALALSVTEPWMSGLGGCGYLVTYQAASGTVEVIDFSTAAPARLDPSAFPLDEAGRVDSDLFGWPRVAGDRNVQGPMSIGLPGSVAGLGLALESFGCLSWRSVVQPAVALARQGHVVDWWSTLKIAGAAASLRLFDGTSRVYLPGGLPPVSLPGASVHLDLSPLADTLDRLAEAGPGDFYRGDIAAAIAADVAAAGGWLDRADLEGYAAVRTVAQSLRHGTAEIHVPRGLNSGPTFADAWARLGTLDPAGSRAELFAAYAKALSEAYTQRLERLGHDGDVAGQGSTTHLSVADGEGNLVALTNTLLSVFGSRVMSPSTGILLNNGVMWFDPRPGRANSLAAGARPLSNMVPLVVTRGGAPWFALGGSGGRRILPAVLQVASFLIDLELSVEAAVHHPRINVDGGAFVEVDPRLGEEVLERIASTQPARAVEAMIMPNHYANTVIAGIEGGTCFGAGQVLSPVSAAFGR
jgi:gamma-glutamyltranspeptidase/glutathione hydrolase